jgi:hypothetical protein
VRAWVRQSLAHLADVALHLRDAALSKLISSFIAVTEYRSLRAGSVSQFTNGNVSFFLVGSACVTADTAVMAKKSDPLKSWNIYKFASKAVWLGTVEASDEAAAIEKAMWEYTVPADKLIGDAAMTRRKEEIIEGLSVTQFLRFGIACCYRVGCDRIDKRLAKALGKLEQSVGPPVNEKMRRDAYNAANSVYRNLYSSDDVIKAVACTLVCACREYLTGVWGGVGHTSRPSVLGNFRSALMKGENLSSAEAIEIENEILQRILREYE